jgi:hypothetical protein
MLRALMDTAQYAREDLQSMNRDANRWQQKALERNFQLLSLL